MRVISSNNLYKIRDYEVGGQTNMNVNMCRSSNCTLCNCARQERLFFVAPETMVSINSNAGLTRGLVSFVAKTGSVCS